MEPMLPSLWNEESDRGFLGRNLRFPVGPPCCDVLCMASQYRSGFRVFYYDLVFKAVSCAPHPRLHQDLFHAVLLPGASSDLQSSGEHLLWNSSLTVVTVELL